ncbi:MAG: hypothetical protein JNM95_08705 [Chitinophagaceae bacterium]|nr:hypothetical protein [Chitinophagaceae bacterium]
MKKFFGFVVLVSTTIIVQAKQWHILPCDTSLPNCITLYNAVEQNVVEAGDTLWFHQNDQCFQQVSLDKKLSLKSYRSLREPLISIPCLSGILFNSGSEGSVIDDLIVRRCVFNVARETIAFTNHHNPVIPVKSFGEILVKRRNPICDSTLQLCKEANKK